MPNEEIEYFKRFAAAYMQWAHSNFDRIVAEAISRDAKAELKRKEDLRMKPLRDQMAIIFGRTNELAKKWIEEAKLDSDFIKGRSWPVGTKLKIRI